MGGASPTKLGGSFANSGKSPMKNTMKLTAKARRTGHSPKKKEGASNGGDHKEKQESGLVSPISVSMQNTFIIKSADESFDVYYHQMKRRKLGQGTNMNMDQSAGIANSATMHASPGMEDSNFGVVTGINPAARDGHSTEISQDGLMFVYGGDRHHMPFNDLFMIRL
jgi:hypothetical protein